ncbi:MAG: hypothetical protein ACTHWQ_09815 [Sphingobacterium sp.]
MKKNILSLLLISCTLFVFIGCTSTQEGDVSKDPKYADIVNQIFITKSPLYYYHYTHSDDKQSGYVLSTDAAISNAELKAEIPIGGHVKINQVLEVPSQNGSVNIMVKGEAFTEPRGAGMEYIATYEEIKPALKP